MSRKFRNWFKASELLALDAANGDSLAVLFLNPSTFALLGRLVEIVRWSGLIENDVPSADYGRLVQGMYMQMGYTHDISGQLEELTRVVDDVRQAITTLDSAVQQVAQSSAQSGTALASISGHTSSIAFTEAQIRATLAGIQGEVQEVATQIEEAGAATSGLTADDVADALVLLRRLAVIFGGV